MAGLFNDMEIKTGKFLVPSNVGDYQDENGEWIDDTKRVFYLYSEMKAFTEKVWLHPNLYEYYLFFAFDQIDRVIMTLEEGFK